jgi:hypothetical protein
LTFHFSSNKCTDLGEGTLPSLINFTVAVLYNVTFRERNTIIELGSLL